MGKVKNLLMDYDEKISIISDIIDLLSSNDSFKKNNSDIIDDLETVLHIINNLDTTKVDSIIYVVNIIPDYLNTLRKEIQGLLTLKNTDKDLSYALMELMEELRVRANHIKKQLMTFLNDRAHVYNSEDFYQRQIEELNNQKQNLETKLEEIQIAHKNLQGHNQEEKDLLSREIHEKEMLLEIANQKLLKYQVELGEKKKQENAIDEWNSKIRMTFSDLKNYLHPIRNEHERLKKTLLDISDIIMYCRLSYYLSRNFLLHKICHKRHFTRMERIPNLRLTGTHYRNPALGVHITDEQGTKATSYPSQAHPRDRIR